MLAYLARRLLIVPPTLFLVSLVIFVVLNLAPGRPGERSVGSMDAREMASRSSYRLFRQQFGLDKPILLNTRFLLSESDVRVMLDEAYLDPGIDPKLRLRARRQIDDHGDSIVRHLVSLLDTPNYAYAATQILADSQRFSARHGWWYEPEASGEVRDEVHKRWKAYYAGHSERFDWPLRRAAFDLFFDTRFARYWRNILHFDFGLSLVDRQPVRQTIADKLKCTLAFMGLSLLLAYTVALPLGLISAMYRGRRLDVAIGLVLFALFSLPTFFVGTVLLQMLAAGEPFRLFPTGGFRSVDATVRTTGEQLLDILWHLALPVFTYAAAIVAVISRYARAGVIEVFEAGYIRAARARGLPELSILTRHVARNGLIPILTLLGGLLPTLVGGSVVVEVVFGIPGMGLYLFDSINLRDYNAVMGVLVVTSFLTLIGVLLSDLSYAIADPRIVLR
ncbi:MAG: ABC transporter permease [Myxococcota bacterium]